MTIGIAAPFSRPARSLAIIAALTFGLVGTVLATSLDASLYKINYSAIQGLGDLQAGYQGGHNYTLTTAQVAAILSKLQSEKGVLHFVAETDLRAAIGPPGSERFRSSVTVGLAQQPNLPIMVHAYRGDSSWLGWNLISGRWYQGSHEVDVSAGFLAATGRKVGDAIVLTVNGKPITDRIVGDVFVPSSSAVLFSSWQALGDPAALAVSHYDIDLKPGVSMPKFTSGLTRALGPGYQVYPPSGPSTAAQIDLSLFRLLELLVIVLAGLGVLNAVLMATRERIHDLGVFKAIGMTPWQTLAMVQCWVVIPTVIAAAVALPVGLALQDSLVRQLAASVDMVLPASFVHVLGAVDLVLLVVGGFAIAIAGSFGPAVWAAASKTTTALRTE